MKALVNKIIPLSTVDGRGLRSAVFFQGCNIRCLYCHNPETWKVCNNCFLCVDKCKGNALSIVDNKVVWDEKKCIYCDTCIHICENHSSPRVKEMDVDEVYNKIIENVPFIRGVTFSGGECTLQEKFLIPLLKKLKEDNLSVFLDSNGMILFEEKEELVSLIDGVMLDVKAWDDDIYHKLTSFSNANVKKNLKYLYSINKLEEIRIVNVPSLVDVSSCLKGIKETLNSDKIDIKLKLIRFRNNGVRGVLEKTPSPSLEEMNSYKKEAEELGFTDILIL